MRESESFFEPEPGSLLKRISLVFGSTWVAATVAGTCRLAGRRWETGLLEPEDVKEFFGSFQLMLGPFLFPNSLFLALFCALLVLRPDAVGLRVWALVIGVEILVPMLEITEQLFYRHGKALAAAWILFGVFMAMLIAAFRFAGQWRRNRMARDLFEVRMHMTGIGGPDEDIA